MTVIRQLSLGVHDERYVVLADPEGNRFCVAGR
jgi:hypothetical protein